MSTGTDSAAPVRAGILVTGTEVITATIADRNGPWLSDQLGRLGVEVAYILTVADRPADLRAALEFMRSQAIELVITTGGLGPTADDLTAAVVAEFAGRELRLDAALEARIAEILAGYARRLSFDPAALDAANRKQALVPEGATPLGPVGTAPGLVVPAGAQVIVVLPGPPRELQPMWPMALATEPVARLLARATPIERHRLRLFGVPESELAESLRQIEAEGAALDRIEITTCLRKGELEVDLRWRQGGEEIADRVREGLAARHGRRLFSPHGKTVDELLGQDLKGRRLAVAESCTAGMLAARITDLPGASAYFSGGAVTYSDQAKSDLLGVDPELIEKYGAVSGQVAEAMARGALERFDADIAVSITGIAGPGGGSEEKPVGYVCFHALTREGASLSRDPVIPGSRADIRERSTLAAMHLLRALLAKERAAGADDPRQ